MLKNIPEKAAKNSKSIFLYCKKAIIYPNDAERRVYNHNNAEKITDNNIDGRTDKFVT